MALLKILFISVILLTAIGIGKSCFANPWDKIRGFVENPVEVTRDQVNRSVDDIKKAPAHIGKAVNDGVKKTEGVIKDPYNKIPAELNRWKADTAKAQGVYDESVKVYEKASRNYEKAQSFFESREIPGIPNFPSKALIEANPAAFVSNTYNTWKGYLLLLDKAGVPVEAINQLVGGSYSTNKWEVKKDIEGSGTKKWYVAWGREINERDAADGVVAAGVSVFTGGASFTLWVENLVRTSILEMQRSIGKLAISFERGFQDRMVAVAEKTISDGLRGKKPNISEIIESIGIEMKAGVLKYSGANQVILPGGNDVTISRTFGYIPFVAVRLKNNNQINTSIQSDRANPYSSGFQKPGISENWKKTLNDGSLSEQGSIIQKNIEDKTNQRLQELEEERKNISPIQETQQIRDAREALEKAIRERNNK